jgi:putative hydrolase of the HAD superfamily
LADELAERFIRERRSRHALFPETEHVLQELYSGHRLALVTNGVPDLQREKIQATNLERFFESLVLSGDVGVGKPDPRIFSVALEGLSASPEEAVMVGDSLHRDIAGARGVGMRGIWVNRARAAADIDITPEGEVAALTGIEDALQEFE